MSWILHSCLGVIAPHVNVKGRDLKPSL